MEELKKIMKKILKENGIDTTKETLDELYDVYENCQEWGDGEMLTGNTFDEIEDFVKYSPCVEEIFKKNQKYVPQIGDVLLYSDVKFSGYEHIITVIDVTDTSIVAITNDMTFRFNKEDIISGNISIKFLERQTNSILIPKTTCEDTDCPLNCDGQCNSISSLLTSLQIHGLWAESCLEHGKGENINTYLNPN